MKVLTPIFRILALLGILALPVLQLVCEACLFGDCAHEVEQVESVQPEVAMMEHGEMPPCHAEMMRVEKTPKSGSSEPAPSAPCDPSEAQCDAEILPEFFASFPQVDRASSSQESFSTLHASAATAGSLHARASFPQEKTRPGPKSFPTGTPAPLFTLHSSWLL